MLQNQKLRAKAEAYLNGLQSARIEAVRQNAQVEFVLTDDDPISPLVNAITPIATGRNFVVRSLDPATGLYAFVEGRSAEGSGTSEGDSELVSTTSSDSTVTFNGFGTTTLAAAVTIQVKNPSGGACAPTGPMRCLNVVVSPGGQVKMCDPAVSATGDTRKC
jgi:type IV fimbrial biogenesis protein FimT